MNNHSGCPFGTERCECGVICVWLGGKNNVARIRKVFMFIPLLILLFVEHLRLEFSAT